MATRRGALPAVISGLAEDIAGLGRSSAVCPPLLDAANRLVQNITLVEAMLTGSNGHAAGVMPALPKF